ncbi:N-6 DNA methylase [Streptosporangium carneum]|nr:N-6 DNA methylase [Streptosporangium carneum]
MPNDATVNAADIARLADVGRAAVSNWRKRYEDFPQPVGGTATSPAFSLSEIEDWLRKQGKKFTVSPGDRVWQRLRSTVDDLRLGDAVGSVGALLLFIKGYPAEWRKLAERENLLHLLQEALTRAVPDAPGGLEMLDDVELVRGLADFAEQVGPVEVFDFLFERYAETHSRRLLATPAEIARLVADLVEGRVVFDPACGIGTLLVAARAEVLLGQDVDEAAAKLTAVRLLLHDRHARVVAADSLRHDGFAADQADAVICNPPFGERTWGYEELAGDPRWEYGLPPRGEPELAWAQHCLAHVRPGGVVAIMMPSVAADRRSGRRIRGNLLRSGALRAVVSLPVGAAPGTSMAPDLWLLRKPAPDDPTPIHVLMVEAAEDLSLVRRAWGRFRQNPETEMAEPNCRTVRLIDLLDEEVNVSPGRYVTPTTVVVGETFERARERLRQLFPGELPELRAARTPRDLSMTTAGELARAGLVEIYQAPLKMTLGEGDLPVITSGDVTRGGRPSGRTSRDAGAVFCQAGDVIAPILARESTSMVVDEEGQVLGPQLYLFRADPDRIDPYFLAGFLRMAGGARAARASSVSSRIDARRAPIPRLPLAEQKRYGEVFRRLMAFENTAREITELSAALVRAGFEGLVDGTLDPHA